MSDTPAGDAALTVAEVLAAADACVAAFGRHDRAAYFACFGHDATFVFHTTPAVLPSRAAWEAEWDRLVAEEGFRVLGCTSDDRRVQLLGDDVAVFTHRVCTTAEVGGAREETDERETIVFERREGAWLAVHEHLSPTAQG